MMLHQHTDLYFGEIAISGSSRPSGGTGDSGKQREGDRGPWAKLAGYSSFQAKRT